MPSALKVVARARGKVGKGEDQRGRPALVEGTCKGRKTYVQTYTTLAHAIDRAAHGGRLPGILAHPQQPRRINFASGTGYTFASDSGTQYLLPSVKNGLRLLGN